MSMSNSPISRFNNDSLELVLQACDGCPWTLRIVSQVCRRWYEVSHRPSVWRTLRIDRVNAHAAYRRFLCSEYNVNRLNAVRTLFVSKPLESRHTHMEPLPFENLTNITCLHTSHLCLTEIEYLSRQLVDLHDKITSLICKSIETWCDTRKFSFNLISSHKRLKSVHFDFAEISGFAYIHVLQQQQEEVTNPRSLQLKSFSLCTIQDVEWQTQKNLFMLLEEAENNRNEAYSQSDVAQAEIYKQMLLNTLNGLEETLIAKYTFFTGLYGVERLDFGFCYSWTPKLWRECFGKVIKSSPNLEHLGLHGWDQFGKLEKKGYRSSTIQPIRIDAEQAISECFELVPNLKSLKLVDFSIGPGLLKAGKHIQKSIQHLEIAFSKSFVKHLNEPADIWLLLGPLKEFVAAAFSGPYTDDDRQRKVVIRLDLNLLNKVENNPFFKDEPLLESIQETLRGSNVQVELLQFYD